MGRTAHPAPMIAMRVWEDPAFQAIWNARWSEPSRVPKQRPWPYEPLPHREELCLSRRQKFKKLRIRLFQDAVERLGASCMTCGAMDNLVPDHILPIAWGGVNEEPNIQPLCGRCNSIKAGKLPLPPGEVA